MASPSDGALDGWGEDISGEQDKPILLPSFSRIPTVAEILEQCRELRYIDGFGTARQFLGRHSVDIVEV